MVLGIISVVIGVIIFIGSLAKGVENVQQQTVQHLDFIWGSLFVIGGFIMITLKKNKDNSENVDNEPSIRSRKNQLIMWDCPKCNNANPNDVFTCEKCGYSLE